jgi:hypothetical protein
LVAAAIFCGCLLLVMRGRRLSSQNLALLQAGRAEENARKEAEKEAAKELRRKNGCLTDVDELEEGVKVVATELVDMSGSFKTDVADLRSQVEELKSQNKELHTQLVRELAELRSLVKPM